MKVIKFTLNDGAVREFSSESHGEDFTATAASFESENKAQISFRTDTEVEVTQETPDAPTADVPVEAVVEAPVEQAQTEPAPEAASVEPAPVAPETTTPPEEAPAA